MAHVTGRDIGTVPMSLRLKYRSISCIIDNKIIQKKIQPVLGFTAKKLIFGKGKQTVCGGCLLKGI